MSILLWIILATLIVSLLSLIGVFTIFIKVKTLDKILLHFVGFSAGALLGGALLHLIPEASKSLSIDAVSLVVLFGFASFFIIERVLHWRHCHHHGGDCQVHTFTYMNLIGDGVHNFIDGLIIAASFVSNIPLGISTTLAVMSHELPQEIADFGVLLHGGFSKSKALLFNFLSAITAVIGAVFGYFMSNTLSSFSVYLLPFAAGGFIYISASDLVPELHKEVKIKKAFGSFMFFICGILFMLGVKLISH